jgi:uncharacterized protein
MKHLVSMFLVGVLFALGLGLSGMTNADKVIGFLNLAGIWDPSLAFVMVGAIGSHLALYKFILKHPAPLFGEQFEIMSRTDIDGRLIAGSAIFGMGWGLGGFCPGPGLVASAALGTEALVFVAAMLCGMILFHKLNAPQQTRMTDREKPNRADPTAA